MIDEDLVRRLPLPLAQLYRRAHNAKSALERHLTAFYLWEATLKLLASAAVVAYAERAEHDPQLAERLQSLARPALGHWWEFVHLLVPALADGGDAGFGKVRDLVLGATRDDLPRCAGLDAVLRRELEGKPEARATVRLTELFDRLVTHRNKVLGHAAPGQLTDDFHERLAGALLAALTELLGRLDVLAGRRLLYIAEVRQVGGVWLVQRYELTGESARRIESLEVPRAQAARLPDGERVYLAAPLAPGGEEPLAPFSPRGRGVGGEGENPLRPLHPLLLYDAEAEAVLFLNARRGKRRTEYLCYTTGQTADRADLGCEQRQLLARVLGMAVAEAQAEQWADRSQAEEPSVEGPPPARRVLGEFELLSELGRGGMGVVYRAWQPSLGRQVALKCLFQTGDPKAEARFRREIRALGHVEHPHLVKVFTSGADGDQWFYAMELVEGVPLSAVCDQLQTRAASVTAVDLRRFLATEPVQARPVTGVERGLRWARRHPTATGLLAVSALALLALAVGGLGWYYETRLQDSNRNLQAALHDASEQREAAEAARAEVERQRDLVRRYSYAVHTSLATNAWRDELVSRMLFLLDEQRPERTGGADLRGFEWYYLWHLAHSDLLTLKGHTDVVSRVAFSPDGKRLASASQDQTARVWDAQTGHEILILKGHTGRVRSVAFSPDGKRLASASNDRTVKMWDTHTGAEELSFKGHADGVLSVAFSPDGKRLASASMDQTVRLWDNQTGAEELTLRGHTDTVYWVAFSPDGKRLASASKDRTVRVWDARTGEQKLTLKGHTNWVFSVAFSPDGTRLASGSADRTVKIWDATNGEVALTFTGHTDRVYDVAFSPDGRRLASTSRGQAVKVWDAQTGQVTLILKGHTGPVLGVSFSPDGSRLASASADRTVKLWDAEHGQDALALRGHTDSVSGVSFSPDGSRLASASADRTVKLWDARSGQEAITLQGHTAYVRSVAFSPDGRRLASSSDDRTVKVWDTTSGKEALSFKGHTDRVYGVAFSPDGTRLATASADQTVKVWDAANGQVALTFKGHTDQVLSVAFSPDGARLASASDDKTVKVWDATTGEVALTLDGHTSAVYAVAFSPDGTRLASASADETAKVWDARRGQEVVALQGHTGDIQSVAFSPDGRRLATASADSTVKVWDARSGQETLTLQGHRGAVLSVAFSPDGRSLVSAGNDGTMKLWNAKTGAEAPVDHEVGR
jgi:WD40 repeat protein